MCVLRTSADSPPPSSGAAPASSRAISTSHHLRAEEDLSLVRRQGVDVCADEEVGHTHLHNDDLDAHENQRALSTCSANGASCGGDVVSVSFGAPSGQDAKAAAERRRHCARGGASGSSREIARSVHVFYGPAFTARANESKRIAATVAVTGSEEHETMTTVDTGRNTAL